MLLIFLLVHFVGSDLTSVFKFGFLLFTFVDSAMTKIIFPIHL